MSTATTPASIVDGAKTQAFRWDLRNCESKDIQVVKNDKDEPIETIVPDGAVKRLFLEQTLAAGREVSRTIYGPDGDVVFQWSDGETFDVGAQSAAAAPAKWGHAEW